MESDVVVVGAGLAGLVATAELVDRGKRVVLVDQEGEQSIGGQAFWSFGGSSSSTPPSSAGWASRTDWSSRPRTGWGRRSSTATRTSGRVAGRRPTSTSPPERSARGCTSRATGSSRSSGGRSAGTAAPKVTATPCRASTSPGAPGRGSSSPSSAACARASDAGLVSFAFRHRVDALVETGGTVTGVRGRVLAPDACGRGRPSNRDEVGDFEITAQAVIVTSGGIGGDHDLVRRAWPERLGTPPARMVAGVPAHVDGRMLGITESAGGTGHQPGPDVALHRGAAQLGPRVGQPRHPHPARALVALARRPRPALPTAVLPGLRHPRHARTHHAQRPRLLVVRADPAHHREGVRPLRLGAEPRPHRQGRQAGARSGPQGRPRPGRGLQAARLRLRRRRHARAARARA